MVGKVILKMADGVIESRLLHRKELVDNDISSLRASLHSKRVDLWKIAANVSPRLIGSLQKNDIIERLIGMAKIGVAHDDGDSEAISSILYLTDDMKRVLYGLLAFSSVKQWGKQLSGVLRDFTFMNLLIYLIYGRERSFDMQSLKAFKSLKA